MRALGRPQSTPPLGVEASHLKARAILTSVNPKRGGCTHNAQHAADAVIPRATPATEGSTMKRKLWFVVPALLASSTAMAHGGHDHVHGLIAGLAHPFGGVDHLVAMVGVGLLAGILGGAARWQLPLAFVAAMALGAVAGLVGIGNGAPIEQAIALGVLTLGLAVAFAARLRPALATVLVAACAIFHGHAHGAELPSQADALTYIAGFAASTALLHLAGLGLALLLHTRRVAASAVRVAGGAIALAGLVMVVV